MSWNDSRIGQLTDASDMKESKPVEAVEEGFDLLLNGMIEPVGNNQSSVLILVLLSDRYLGTTLFELDDLLLSKLVVLDCELLLYARLSAVRLHL